MSEITVETVADAMFELVKEYAGKKKLKPLDLTKNMREKFGDGCDKKMCQNALRSIIESGKVVYTYFGASIDQFTLFEIEAGYLGRALELQHAGQHGHVEDLKDRGRLKNFQVAPEIHT